MKITGKACFHEGSALLPASLPHPWQASRIVSQNEALGCSALRQAECPRLHAELASVQAKYADLQHRTQHLAAEHKAAGELVHAEALKTAQEDASQLRDQLDRCDQGDQRNPPKLGEASKC